MLNVSHGPALGNPLAEQRLAALPVLPAQPHVTLPVLVLPAGADRVLETLLAGQVHLGREEAAVQDGDLVSVRLHLAGALVLLEVTEHAQQHHVVLVVEDFVVEASEDNAEDAEDGTTPTDNAAATVPG